MSYLLPSSAQMSLDASFDAVPELSTVKTVESDLL